MFQADGVDDEGQGLGVVDQVEEGVVLGEGVADRERLIGTQAGRFPQAGGHLVDRFEQAADFRRFEEIVEDDVPLLLEVPLLLFGHGDGHGSAPVAPGSAQLDPAHRTPCVISACMAGRWKVPAVCPRAV